MKNKIRKYFFKRFKQKNQKKTQRKCYLNYRDIKMVLLLFDTDIFESNDDFLRIKKELINDNKQVDSIGYIDKKENKIIPQVNVSFFDKKQISWTQKPNDRLLNKVKKKEYDLVIDLTPKESLPLLYLSFLSKNSFTVGTYISHYDSFDLVVKQEDDNAENYNDIYQKFQQIIFYLKKIESKQ